jgi:hypothetical protein
MSMGDMNYASAISEGNSLSRNVAEHNEGIRQNNQLLVQAWNTQKSRDASQTSKDKETKGVEDAYGGFTAVGTIAQGYQRVRQVGIGGAVSQDVARLKRGGQAVASALSSTPTPPKPNVDGIEVSGTESGGTADRVTTTAGAEEEGNVASKIGNTLSDTEQVSGKIMKGLKTAGTVGKIAGAGMGIVSAVSGIDDMADGNFAKMDTAHKVGDSLSTAGGLLDIASIFLPVLAPLGAVVSVAGAIDNTVNMIGDDKDKENQDANSEQNQVNSNKNNIEVSPTFSSMSLVGSAQHSVSQSVAGTSSGAF